MCHYGNAACADQSDTTHECPARAPRCENCRREIAADAHRASDRTWSDHLAASPRCHRYYAEV